MGFPMGPCDYISWHRVNGRLPFMKLAKNIKVEKWLLGRFLKLALPHARLTFEMAMIEAPLNLTAFFRILVHLHEIGYPAHWLSDIVSMILSGRITTTARAPRSMPLSVKEVEKNFSNRVMCVKPFVAEFSTLATIWQRVLPFGLLTAHSRLPKIEDIKEFEVTFSDPRGDNFLSLNAAIVLFDTSSGKGFQAKAAKNLRPWLLDDEKGDMTVEAKKIRDGCIHDLSTFSWDSKGNKSSFWLRKDVIGSIKESGTWKIFLWRTDTWERVSDGVSIDKMKEGKSWV